MLSWILNHINDTYTDTLWFFHPLIKILFAPYMAFCNNSTQYQLCWGQVIRLTLCQILIRNIAGQQVCHFGIRLKCIILNHYPIYFYWAFSQENRIDYTKHSHRTAVNFSQFCIRDLSASSWMFVLIPLWIRVWDGWCL